MLNKQKLLEEIDALMEKANENYDDANSRRDRDDCSLYGGELSAYEEVKKVIEKLDKE